MEIVTTLGELHTLRARWNALWHADTRATAFQSPAWLLPWAQHFAPERTGAVALHAQDALVALIPFFSWQGKLLLAGTGPSDYGDGLFAGAHVDAAAVLQALCAVARDLHCDCVDLQQLREISPLLQAPAPSGWQAAISAGDTCPVAMLTGGDGLDGIPARRKKKLAYAARSLQRRADHVVRLVAVDELEHAMAATAYMHAQRWGAREESGIFSDTRMRAFIADALPELAADEVLRLHVLQIGAEEIAAAALVLRNRSAACLYLCTFAERWSRYSPGLLTIAGAMRHAANEGAQQFHFLRGGETYKYDLGAVDTPTYRRRLWRHSASGRFD